MTRTPTRTDVAERDESDALGVGLVLAAAGAGPLSIEALDKGGVLPGASWQAVEIVRMRPRVAANEVSFIRRRYAARYGRAASIRNLAPPLVGRGSVDGRDR